MAETEPGRHWSFRPGDWSFPSSVLRGIHPLWRNAPFHFNPGVFQYLLRFVLFRHLPFRRARPLLSGLPRAGG